MNINLTHDLLTYSQFKAEIVKVIDLQGISTNYTDKEYCGATLTLYDAQEGVTAVEYLQSREWRYYYNSYVGVGLTLTEAIDDHTVQYKEYYLNT